MRDRDLMPGKKVLIPAMILNARLPKGPQQEALIAVQIENIQIWVPMRIIRKPTEAKP